MSKMKIKPCPFCGGEARNESCGNYWVKCTKCGSRGSVKNTEKEAINQWNTRKRPLKKEKNKKVRFSHDSYAYCPHCGREIVDFLMKPGRCVKCNGEIDWD